MGKRDDESKGKAATGEGEVGTEDAGVRKTMPSGVDEPDRTKV